MFLNHGEPDALAALKTRLLAAGFGDGQVIVPEMDASFALAGPQAAALASGAGRLPAGAASRADWHNARAALNLALNAALAEAPDDAARDALIAALAARLAQAQPAA